MEDSVTEMELETSVACFLARSADYLEVPAGEGRVCAAAAARADKES